MRIHEIIELPNSQYRVSMPDGVLKITQHAIDRNEQRGSHFTLEKLVEILRMASDLATDEIKNMHDETFGLQLNNGFCIMISKQENPKTPGKYVYALLTILGKRMKPAYNQRTINIPINL